MKLHDTNKAKSVNGPMKPMSTTHLSRSNPLDESGNCRARIRLRYALTWALPMLLWIGTLQAANGTDVVVFDNTHLSRGNAITAGTGWQDLLTAQGFMIGDSDNITSVIFEARRDRLSGGRIIVEVWDDDGSGFPGQRVATLGSVEADSLSMDWSFVTVHGLVSGLVPHTPYFIVLNQPGTWVFGDVIFATLSEAGHYVGDDPPTKLLGGGNKMDPSDWVVVPEVNGSPTYNYLRMKITATKRLPMVDFDGNGTVDIQDLLMLIESWGQDDPVVDIAPAPFGDGIVDVLDLELLMSYWGHVAHDTTLIDNFNDGDADGWTIVDFTVGQPWGPGTFDASSGAYHFEGGDLVPVGRAFDGFLSAMWDQSSEPIFTNGFVRATIRVETQGSLAGIMLRSTPGNFYAFLGTTHGGRFLFNKLVNGSIEQVRQLPDDLSFGLNEDWNIEAGAVGDQLSMTVWRVGEPKPESPQLILTDGAFNSGTFGIAAGIDDRYTQPARVSATFDDIYFIAADGDNNSEQ